MIQPCEERHCSAKYLRLFTAVNVVGESACKEDIGDNDDAGTVAHRAPSEWKTEVCPKSSSCRGGGINNYGDRRCKDAAKLCEYGESRSVPSRRVKQRWDFNSGSSDALIEKQATVIPSWKSIEDLSEEKGSSACSPCSCAQHENQVYQLTVGKDSWIESYDALIYPVDSL